MVKLTTLSKAISITPRKTIFNLRLLILLVFLLTLCPLGAESWRYSVIGENQEYVSLVESTLSLIPYADGEEAISKVVERVERSKRIEEDKKKAQYYEDENYNALSSFSYSSLPPVDVVQLEKVSLSLSQYDSLLSDGDKDTYEYLMIQNNLDALFYVRSKGEGTIKEIELLYNGDVIRKAYYTTSLYSFEEEALGLLYLASFTSSFLLCPECRRPLLFFGVGWGSKYRSLRLFGVGEGNAYLYTLFPRICRKDGSVGNRGRKRDQSIPRAPLFPLSLCFCPSLGCRYSPQW